jgi:hypothetical protein
MARQYLLFVILTLADGVPSLLFMLHLTFSDSCATEHSNDMYKPRELSNFNTVRATWEARDREQTLPKPPVAVSKLAPLQPLPNGMRRLSSRSFTMFSGQLNPFRSKGSVRGRQSSTGAPAATKSKTSFRTLGSRDSSVNIASENQQPQHHHAQYTVLNTSISDYPHPPLPKSRTTSFLPIPYKQATTSLVRLDPEEPALVHSQRSASLFRSRIPTPSGLREHPSVKSTRTAASRTFAGLRKPSSSRLQRASTQPNLLTATGRKASEFARKGAPKTSYSEEAAPLLETTAEEDERLIPERTALQRHGADKGREYLPKRQVQFTHQLEEYPPSCEWNQSRDFEYEFAPLVSTTSLTQTNNIEVLRTPQRVRSCPQRTELPFSSNRVIQCHRLLSPILPQSPPASSLPIVHEQMPLTPITAHQDVYEMLQRKARAKSSNPVIEEEGRESEWSPSFGRDTPPNPTPAHKQVGESQPAAYWAGRFMSLKDSLLSNSFDLHHRLTAPSDTESSNTSSASLIFLPVNKDSILIPEVQQAIQIFDMLERHCTTEAASRSLLDFRNAWANKHRLPSVARYLPRKRRPNSWVPGLVDKEGLAKSTGSQGSYRKLSFMERLKMKSRKSSGKSEKSATRTSGCSNEDREGLLS